MKPKYYIFLLLPFLCGFASLSRAQVADNADFALQLFQELYGTKTGRQHNILYAPLSVAGAFAMPYSAATGLTRQQLGQVFRFDANANKNLNQYHKLIAGLEQNVNVSMRLSSGFWVERSVGKDAVFLQNIQKFDPKATIFETDFSKNYEVARTEINEWATEQSEKNVKTVLPKGSLNALTRAVLVAPTYFQGNWATGFDAALTATNAFYGLNGKQIITEFMTKSLQQHRYFEDSKRQVLELPYSGEEISMVLVLNKKEGEGFEDFNAATYKNCLKGLESRPVVVTLPKFALRSQYNFRAALRQMGLKEPFTDAATFDQLFQQNLRLSGIYQQTLLIVKEDGEAPKDNRTPQLKSSKPTAFFNANRPFLFFIKDNRTDAILFMGYLVQPVAMQEEAYSSVSPKRFIEHPVPPSDELHWVKAGETLYGIAKNYNVSVEQIIRLNQLTDKQLRIGQELLIREGEKSKPRLTALTATTEKPKPTTHTVERGETIFSIARKYNLSVEQIKKWNGLTSEVVKIDQKLIISETKTEIKPETTPETKPTTKPATPKTYKVQAGDTLWKVAQKFSIPVETLRQLNKLKSDELSIGMELIISDVKH